MTDAADVADADELEQLARSLAMDGTLVQHDAELAAQASRRLARFERQETNW